MYLLVIAGVLLLAGVVLAARRRHRQGRGPAGGAQPATARHAGAVAASARNPNEAPARPASAPSGAPPGAPAGGPAGGEGLPRLLRVSTLSLWRRAFKVADGPLTVPEGHGFAAQALEQVLAGDSLGERWFPRRPMLMPQLQAAANDPEAPPTRLAGIIAQDPVLAGDVLRLANSAYYRLSPDPIESLQRAVITCGTDGLHRLAATALMQPVFRAGSHSHPRFAQLLWERSARAAPAAEACAREWCPADRQAAQLLPLLAALGPLVAYRIVEEAYRAARQPLSPEACLALVLRHGGRVAALVAGQWEMPGRLAQVLAGEVPADAGQAVRMGQLQRAWQGGELIATLTLLADEQLLGEDDYQRQIGQAGVPLAVANACWERSVRSRAAV